MVGFDSVEGIIRVRQRTICNAKNCEKEEKYSVSN